MEASTYGALIALIKKTLAGAGALKGKNCIISSIESITGGHRVNFQWTLDNGTVETGYMDVLDGTSCQLPILPEASAGAEDMIVQYIGETTQTLTNGYFYKCVENSGSYEWVNISVQEGGSSSNTFNEDDFVVENDEVSLAPAQRTFTGTTEEWELLTAEEKALYGTVQLTDDGDADYKDVYSTSEVKTSKVWIDGKPIYRKVLYNNGSTIGLNVDVSALKIDTMVEALAEGTDSGYVYNLIGSGHPSGKQILFSNNNTVMAFTGQTSGTVIPWCILYYTKTTD